MTARNDDEDRVAAAVAAIALYLEKEFRDAQPPRASRWALAGRQEGQSGPANRASLPRGWGRTHV